MQPEGARDFRLSCLMNPYTAEEILELSRSRKVGWLIVKRIVQLDPDPVEDRDRLLTLLGQDFVLVRSLGNYDLYRPKAISPDQAVH